MPGDHEAGQVSCSHARVDVAAGSATPCDDLRTQLCMLANQVIVENLPCAFNHGLPV